MSADQPWLDAPIVKPVQDDPDKPWLSAPLASAAADAPEEKKPAAPVTAESRARWDLLGDIGRAAKESGSALVEDASAAGKSLVRPVPPKPTSFLQSQADVITGIPGDIVNSVKGLGSALKVPLDAIGVLSSPITGAARATIGSAMSYLPGFDKEKADQAVDQAMMAARPGRGELPRLAGALPTDGPVSVGTNPYRSPSTPGSSDAALKVDATAAANNLKDLSAAKVAPKFAAARDAGYVIPPTEASSEPGVVANALSSVGGKIKMQQAASVKNQSVTNSIAAKELGLPADAMLDEATFSKVRQDAGKAYQAVEDSMSKLPGGKVEANDDFLNKVVDLDKKGAALRRDFPELATNPDIDALQTSLLKQDFSPRAGVEAIKRLRFQSKSNLKSFDNPAKLELGLAQRDGANAIEDLIETRLEENGDSATVQAYRDARQTIAKSHDIEAATDANGNVDARKIARLGERRPFSGGLKTIADTASAFGKSMQNPDKFGGLERRSILDTGVVVGSGLASLHNPAMAAGALVPLLRPFARNLALSEGLQNRLAGGGGNALSALNQSGGRLAAASPGVGLLQSMPLPSVQNYLAQGARVGLLTAPAAAPTPPPNQ